MRDRTCWATSGQGKVEYALVISLVVIVVGAALILLGSSLGDIYATIVDTVKGDTPTAAPMPSTPTLTPTPTILPELTPSPTPEIDKRLSYSDFEDGSALEWYEARGKKWRVEDGAYWAGSGGEHRSFTGDESWTDYTIELEVDLKRGNGYGVYFRATDPDRVNGYCFQYDPGYGRGAFLFRKVENGREGRPLVREWAPKGYDWYTGPRDVRLEVVGNVYTAFVDGVQVAQMVDDSYTHGAVGLRTWDGTVASFDNVTVTRVQ